MPETPTTTGPVSRLARLPFFYGWVVVGIAFVTMAIGVNARTAFSLQFPPILDEFGWTRGAVAGAPSVVRRVLRAAAPEALRERASARPQCPVRRSGTGAGREAGR